MNKANTTNCFLLCLFIALCDSASGQTNSAAITNTVAKPRKVAVIGPTQEQVWQGLATISNDISNRQQLVKRYTSEISQIQERYKLKMSAGQLGYDEGWKAFYRDKEAMNVTIRELTRQIAAMELQAGNIRRRYGISEKVQRTK